MMLQPVPGLWTQKRYCGAGHAAALAVNVTGVPVPPGGPALDVRVGLAQAGEVSEYESELTASYDTALPCPRSHEFRFWVQPPGGSWTSVQGYGSSSTYVWHPPSTPGVYGLEVDVRDVGAAATYETVANVSYSITPPCAKPTVSPSPVSPQTVGTPVTVSAVTSACPTPQYRFWVLPPGGRWTVAQDYGSSSTFSWNTSGLAFGAYLLNVPQTWIIVGIIILIGIGVLMATSRTRPRDPPPPGSGPQPPAG